MKPLSYVLLLLATLLWHSVQTVQVLGPQYLLFVCYSANLLLCLGIFRKNALLIGTGFGWLLLALPLWLYDAILTRNWTLSCTLFHLIGVVIGGIVIRSYRLPRQTWAFAMLIGIVLQGLARLFTDPGLNINSAFRIYAGWEWLYPNYPIFFLALLGGFSLYFVSFTRFHNRFYFQEKSAGDAG